ncbi:MAG TPA: hypothetical protein VFM54_19805, partial [Micromonosporaceae bacterium]|nr:hypothetical protein [Micromonosporaceae bacterium]
MRNVLVGGLITLIGTILVQILIIPSVQRRTRKRERWERDITELQTLMEADFPKHFRTLRRAIVPFLALHAFPERHRAEALKQLAYKTAVADAVAAHDELRDTAIRAPWLARRAAVYKSGQDSYWSRLLTDIARLNVSVGALEPGGFPKTHLMGFQRRPYTRKTSSLATRRNTAGNSSSDRRKPVLRTFHS